MRLKMIRSSLPPFVLIRKEFLTILAALASSFGFGQTFGTKHDLVAGKPVPAAPGIGFMPFVQMMIALGIVFLIVKFILPKFAAKLNKRLVTGTGSSIKIEDSASFAGGNLLVVSVKGKSLLLSVGQNGVTFLTDVTESKPVTEKPLFMEILEKEEQAPTHCFVEADGEPTPMVRSSLSDGEIQAALERLSRLSA